jgi:hypothetical protein
MNADGLFSGGDSRTYSLDRDDFIKELEKIFPRVWEVGRFYGKVN